MPDGSRRSLVSHVIPGSGRHSFRLLHASQRRLRPHEQNRFLDRRSTLSGLENIPVREVHEPIVELGKQLLDFFGVPVRLHARQVVFPHDGLLEGCVHLGGGGLRGGEHRGEKREPYGGADELRVVGLDFGPLPPASAFTSTSEADLRGLLRFD